MTVLNNESNHDWQFLEMLLQVELIFLYKQKIRTLPVCGWNCVCNDNCGAANTISMS
jgi:hypothetical protein